MKKKSIVSNVQTHYHFKLDLKKRTNIQEASSYSMAPNTTGAIISKAWRSPVEYPSRVCKHDINESEGNMLNPIFKENERSGNTQLLAHLQNDNYLVTRSLYIMLASKHSLGDSVKPENPQTIGSAYDNWDHSAGCRYTLECRHISIMASQIMANTTVCFTISSR